MVGWYKTDRSYHQRHLVVAQDLRVLLRPSLSVWFKICVCVADATECVVQDLWVMPPTPLFWVVQDIRVLTTPPLGG